MHPDLEKLIRLQRVETRLRRVEGELGEVPRRRAEQEAALAEDRGRLERARETLAESQKARRQHEGALQDLEAKRSRYKAQLMEVKTNKEYTAMLHEIEGVEREIRSREDLVLAEMEKAESMTAEVKREEQAFRVAEERQRTDAKVLDERAETLRGENSRLAAERDAVARTLPSDLLELFQRVARLRGLAVAEAREGMCEACHLKLRPQMFVDLKRNEEIAQCPGCNRILFYEAAAPVANPGA